MNSQLARLVYRLAALVRREPTYRYLEEYEKSQWWDDERFADYHRQALKSVEDYIFCSVPYYKSLSSYSFFELPIIQKKLIKEETQQFFGTSVIWPLYKKTTGGSTGEPITIAKDREALAREQAGTLRGYTWAGISPGSKQARFWGVPNKSKEIFQNRVKDFLLNRKRFSAFNYTDSDLRQFLAVFRNWNPHYIYGYVSMVNDFSEFIKNECSNAIPNALKAVITTSEVLTPEIRERIESVFGVPVFNEYGCGEVGTIAHQCEKGSLHVNWENLYLEVLDEDDRPLINCPGRVVVTELHNRAQPLVRYEVGDYATLSSEPCSCGRGLLVLTNIHGRAYDVVFGPDKRRYHPEFFIYIFEDIKRNSEAIRQFQLIQNNKSIRINLIKGCDYHKGIEEIIVSRLKDEFGDYFDYAFSYVDRIPREASGKLRVIKREAPV